MATIKDIADKLGISVSTVSKGLNDAKDISENLRQQVLDTAVELGYTKKKMRTASDDKVCIFIENMDYKKADDFGYDIVLGYKQAAFRAGMSVEIEETGPDFQAAHRYESYILEKGYKAAFLVGFALGDPWMAQLGSTSVPTILLDNFIKSNPNISYIGTDSEEGIDMAIAHLVALGHEKIAFLDGSKDSMISDQRMRAYLRSISHHHLPLDPSMAVYGYFVADAAHYHVPGFLDMGVTAIVCGNDEIAEGVIASCKAEGYSVPEDISVIGFDDIPAAASMVPPLTTVRQNRLEIGKCSFMILRTLMDGVALSKNLLRPSLIVRHSTALARPRVMVRRHDSKDSVLHVNPRLYDEALKERQL
ncbi:LacI family DNA-binding transcriptional regulator [Butyrivibrio sp. MC2013]|uniref:LacI family DNA-binding transcriptional regulator n=1 Tax=Butyrivibrio sp. MC2013 TaxID=1280686 RepID=UPI0003F87AD6|nr:LacI family DNA-binding transcriptional regulator [Butyrivibrio sp. MC2013]